MDMIFLDKENMAYKSIAKIEQQVFQSVLFPPLLVRTTQASSRPYAEHFHESLSLGVLFRGGTRLRCPDGGCTVHAGQIVVFAPREPHSCNPIDGGTRGYHMFYIDVNWVGEKCFSKERDFTVRRRIITDPYFFAKMMTLADAVRNNEECAHWEVYLEQILRDFCAAVPDKSMTKTPPVLTVFQKYGRDAPNESALAARLGVRRETFIRSFRRVTGMPPGRYRQCLRLAQALQLLGAGESIVHAALKSGFADQSHFHRMCVKYFSATPAQLRPRTSLLFKT